MSKTTDETTVEHTTGDGGTEDIKAEEQTWLSDELKQIASHSDSFMSGSYSADMIRYCRWDGQSPDGRKHKEQNGGREPFPFDGCSDSRVRLADMLINELSMVEVAAAMKASLNFQGVEVTDTPKVAKIRTLVKYIITNRWGRRYRRELEKVAQYQNTYTPAVAIMGVFWEEEIGLRNSTVSLGELAQYLLSNFSDQVTEEDAAEAVSLLTDPDHVEDAKALVMNLLPHVRPARARAICKAIRETGEAEFPEPYQRDAGPKICAYRLFEDVFVPLNTGDLEDARVIYVRQLLSRSQIEERRITAGWSEPFIEAMIGNGPGTGLEGKTIFPKTVGVIQDNGTSETLSITGEDDLRGLYEVFTAYWKSTNDDGIRATYKCIFHPSVPVPATPRQLVPDVHGRYPFVDFTRETLTSRMMDSRGVSDIVSTDQVAIKRSDDTIANHAQLFGLPPIFVPANKEDSTLVLRPLGQIPRRRRDDYEVMKGPDYPETVEADMNRREKRLAEYFGRFFPNVDERLIVTHMQNRVDRFLGSLADVLKMTVQLCLQNMPPDAIGRIVGGTGEDLVADLKEIQGLYDIMMEFDVRMLDPEFLIELAKTMNAYILPIDTEQTIERSKLVSFLFSSISPQLAEAVLRPVEEANRKEAEDEEAIFVKIAAGIETPMKDRGQNFALRLQRLMAIGEQNPGAFQRLGDREKAILQKHIKHYEFMIQQQRNATTGRVGAEPVLGGEGAQ